jgi:hypothetical protein
MEKQRIPIAAIVIACVDELHEREAGL